MYQKRAGKLNLPDKNQYTTYNPHNIDLNERKWPEVVKVISIDPGIRNLALRVESRGINSNCYPIKTLVFEKLRITEDDRRLDGNVDQLFFLVTNFLDKYREIFKECHMLIIERQLPINYKAVRVSQHIISYFLFLFKNVMPTLPLIYEVDPKLKTKQLGASKHLNERGVKQWSVDLGKELCVKRQDYDALKILQKNKAKSDDLCDVIVQAESFFSFQGWPLTSTLSTLNVAKSATNNTTKISDTPIDKPLQALPKVHNTSIPPLINTSLSPLQPANPLLSKTITLKIVSK